MAEGLTITYITGPGPVEGWGSYNGLPWYVEIRPGGDWSFSLSEDKTIDPASAVADGPFRGFFLSGRRGYRRHDLLAGMELTDAEVESLIRECIEQYQASMEDAL